MFRMPNPSLSADSTPYPRLLLLISNKIERNPPIQQFEIAVNQIANFVGMDRSEKRKILSLVRQSLRSNRFVSRFGLWEVSREKGLLSFSRKLLPYVGDEFIGSKIQINDTNLDATFAVTTTFDMFSEYKFEDKLFRSPIYPFYFGLLDDSVEQDRLSDMLNVVWNTIAFNKEFIKEFGKWQMFVQPNTDIIYFLPID